MAQLPRNPDSPRRPPTIPYAGSGAPIPASMANAPPQPPPPPRPITAAARRRSWTDPVIRFWLLATVVLVGIAGWFVAQQLIAARGEQWLIANGTQIDDAIALDSNGDNLHPIPAGAIVTLQFAWPVNGSNGDTETVYGILTQQLSAIPPGQHLNDIKGPDGQKYSIKLHVNPNDLSDWTDRQQPEPLIRRLIAGAVIIPAAAATAFAAWWLRRRLLGIWRDSDAGLFGVVESRYSALAPLSHTLRCVSVLGRDSTIVTVYLPSKYARPKQGDVIWLLHRRGKPKPAIAASAFE